MNVNWRLAAKPRRRPGPAGPGRDTALPLALIRREAQRGGDAARVGEKAAAGDEPEAVRR